MRASIALVAAVFTMLVAWSASAQTCLRPKWTECVSFPNGGRHTGVSPAGKSVEIEVPPGSDICVITEWEVRAETYAQFAETGCRGGPIATGKWMWKASASSRIEVAGRRR
jgi:hypothetical protein